MLPLVTNKLDHNRNHADQNDQNQHLFDVVLDNVNIAQEVTCDSY